ncbi:hypothetical protein QEH56_08480 [Pelagicoccus enzymogenes]|uniref:hypothetical protein n=1 Tax=Pelagicoccus enzymogenes TaxID=2773457 RepID=UPI00281052FB|nr:hypothetical protein [Pelagicoccus enzymogenes]MDQ8198178.1 hypothetical protein [Pelagicoccus enzymogenes]
MQASLLTVAVLRALLLAALKNLDMVEVSKAKPDLVRCTHRRPLSICLSVRDISPGVRFPTETLVHSQVSASSIACRNESNITSDTVPSFRKSSLPSVRRCRLLRITQLRRQEFSVS